MLASPILMVARVMLAEQFVVEAERLEGVMHFA